MNITSPMPHQAAWENKFGFTPPMWTCQHHTMLRHEPCVSPVLYHPSSGQVSLAFGQDPLHSDDDITQYLWHTIYFHPTICFHPSQATCGHVIGSFSHGHQSSTCITTS